MQDRPEEMYAADTAGHEYAGGTSRREAHRLQWIVSALNRDPLAVLDHVDPEIEVRMPPQGPARRPAIYAGLSGVRAVIASLQGSFTGLRAELVDVVSIAPQRWVAAVRHTGRGRTSGAECSVVFFHALRFRDGRVVSWAVFATETEARWAAGPHAPVRRETVSPEVEP